MPYYGTHRVGAMEIIYGGRRSAREIISNLNTSGVAARDRAHGTATPRRDNYLSYRKTIFIPAQSTRTEGQPFVLD